MVGAVSGPDAGRAGVVPRPQPRPHLQQLLLNRLQSTSILVTTVTLVCYTLSSTASYLYCSKATYPGADLAVGLGVGLGVDGDDAGAPLLHSHHQRVLSTAGWLVAPSYCVILSYNPWYHLQFCISLLSWKWTFAKRLNIYHGLTPV